MDGGGQRKRTSADRAAQLGRRRELHGSHVPNGAYPHTIIPNRAEFEKMNICKYLAVAQLSQVRANTDRKLKFRP